MSIDAEFKTFWAKAIRVGATVAGGLISRIWLIHHNLVSVYFRFAISVVIAALAYVFADAVLNRWHMYEKPD